MRITADAVKAVRGAVGPNFIVGLRSSQGKVNDFFHKWQGEQEAAEIFTAIGKRPVDYLHTTEFEAWQPAFTEGLSLASLAKRHSGLPVLANGSLHDPQRAEQMLSEGNADMVTLGRGALTHSNWPNRVLKGAALADFDRRILAPLADLENAERIRMES